MSYLLHLTISPNGENSYSRKVAAKFLDAFKAKNPDVEVKTRDLNTEPLPHLDDEAIYAGYTPAEKRTPGQDKKWNARLALIDELTKAHSILISTPMWNWNVPSGLKAYIDQIVIPGVNDNYTKKLVGKSVTVVVATGGAYGAGSPNADADYEADYLHHLFTQLGSSDVEVIRTELTLAGVVPGMEKYVDAKQQSFDAAVVAATARAEGKAATHTPRTRVAVPKNTTSSPVNTADSGYVLHITHSPNGDNSSSRKVAAEFLKAFQAKNKHITVKTLDLNSEPLPHLDGEAIYAGYTPAEKRTPGQDKKWNARLALIDELTKAHSILISTPMWNWNVPSGLKAYIDQIVIPGVNDNYTKKLVGKSVTVVMATGGAYGAGSPNENADFEAGYLHHLFTQLGSNDVEVIRTELTLAGVVPGMEKYVDAKQQSFDAAVVAATARAGNTVIASTGTAAAASTTTAQPAAANNCCIIA